MSPKHKKHKGFFGSQERIFQLKFCLIYSLPLWFILAFFPYKDPIFLSNPYPFKASFSGTVIDFEMGFTQIPATIPTYTRSPMLSALGIIPKDLFAYETCIHHFSFFYVQNEKIESDAVSLDVRAKVGSNTIHLSPNATLCLPPDNEELLTIFVGDALTDGNKAADLLNRNDKRPINGKTEVIVKERSVYGKIALFFGILFTFYPLYWGVILTWSAVHKLLLSEKK